MSIKLNANVKNVSIMMLGMKKHHILYCNAPDIVKLRTMFFKDNKPARIRSECASSFIEGILATSKGNPQLIGKF